MSMMEWLTVKQVADRLGLSADSVYVLIGQGRIESHRVGPSGGRHRIRPEAVDEYLSGCKAVPTVIVGSRRATQIVLDGMNDHF